MTALFILALVSLTVGLATQVARSAKVKGYVLVDFCADLIIVSFLHILPIVVLCLLYARR